MVTLNINIEGDGKGINPPNQIATRAESNQLPTPESMQSVEGVDASAPTPNLSDNSIDANLAQDSVPHPELTGLSTSSVAEDSPIPMDDAALTSGDDGTPVPSDTESKTTATPTKRKSRTTKTKTSGK